MLACLEQMRLYKATLCYLEAYLEGYYSGLHQLETSCVQSSDANDCFERELLQKTRVVRALLAMVDVARAILEKKHIARAPLVTVVAAKMYLEKADGVRALLKKVIGLVHC